MWPKVRIVCGTGRCGTNSFTELLRLQEGVYATHEGLILPWEKDLVAYYQGLLRFILNPAAGDAKIIVNVAFYWKNYLSEVFRDIPDVRVLFLKRDREKVVNSFAGMYNQRNFWSDPKGKNFEGRESYWSLGTMFPSYDLPKREAIGRYWDEYYADADFWIDKFPESTMQISTEGALGSGAVQREALEFLGIENPVIDTNIKKNTTEERPPVFDIGEPVNINELYDKARQKISFGQAAETLGLKLGAEVQLTDDEWDSFMKIPIFQKLVEGENGNVDNG